MFLIRSIIISALIAGCCFYNATAQTGGSVAGKVAGIVFNADKRPVSYATIVLLKKDSTIAGGDLTREEGSFSVDVPDTGSYSLRISGIGITTKTVNNIRVTIEKPMHNLGTVIVNSNTQSLQEVKITGERQIGRAHV